MIRLIEAEKTYDNGTHALNGVSFTVDDGEFVFLVGPSGSGKSTIIKLLTGEVVPTAGRVMVNGFSMSRISERQIPYMRRTIGVIFQDFRLIGSKTVYDNLALAMRAVGASRGRCGSVSPMCWSWWDWRTRRTAIPMSCPAASSSASPLPGRW